MQVSVNIGIPGGAVKGSGGSVPFTAASESGCILALRADLGIATTGTNVTLWADQSSAGNNATAATNNPQFTSGNNYVSFTAASTQSLVCNGIANSLNNTDQACSVFALVYRTDSVAARAFLGTGKTGTFGLQVFGATTQRLQVARRDDATTQVTFTSTASLFTDATWEIQGCTIPGTTLNSYTDTTGSPSQSAQPFDVGTITAATATANARIGASANATLAANYWDGRIAAICVYNTDKTSQASTIIANLVAWAQSVGLM